MASEMGVLLQHAFKAFSACHNAVSNIVLILLKFFSIPTEMSTLRQAEDEEVILFELKEKQC
jgi:hypothetical protein